MTPWIFLNFSPAGSNNNFQVPFFWFGRTRSRTLKKARHYWLCKKSRTVILVGTLGISPQLPFTIKKVKSSSALPMGNSKSSTSTSYNEAFFALEKPRRFKKDVLFLVKISLARVFRQFLVAAVSFGKKNPSKTTGRSSSLGGVFLWNIRHVNFSKPDVGFFWGEKRCDFVRIHWSWWKNLKCAIIPHVTFHIFVGS